MRSLSRDGAVDACGVDLIEWGEPDGVDHRRELKGDPGTIGHSEPVEAGCGVNGGLLLLTRLVHQMSLRRLRSGMLVYGTGDAGVALLLENASPDAGWVETLAADDAPGMGAALATSRRTT